MSDEHQRLILHLDVDAFYVAVERELNPELLKDRPVAVSQYNPHGDLSEVSADNPLRIITNTNNDGTRSNGSMIAVSYEARAAGVKRGDRGVEAMAKCDDLLIVQVPVKHGKADLAIYRNASTRVVSALVEGIQKGFCKIYHFLQTQVLVAEVATVEQDEVVNNNNKFSTVIVEKASVDEIYLDVTQSIDLVMTFIESNDNDDSRSRGLLQQIFRESSAFLTTVGGFETETAASLAVNALRKRDVSRGSSIQVLDSATRSVNTDAGSKSWWERPLENWTRQELKLGIGAAVAALARSFVFDCLGYTLSAGISTNKTLAKLASGLKKPNRQTLIYPNNSQALQKLFHPLPLDRIRGLGGKFGLHVAHVLNISTVGELAMTPYTCLVQKFPEQAKFLHSIAMGICTDEVSHRVLGKSVGCSKNFRRGTSMVVTDLELIRMWSGQLTEELTERLQFDEDENLRKPKLLVVSIKIEDENGRISKSASKSCAAPRVHTLFAEAVMNLIRQIIDTNVPSPQKQSHFVTLIHLSATNFIEIADDKYSILKAFERQHQHNINSTQSRLKSTKTSSIEKGNIVVNQAKLPQKRRKLMDSWLSSSTNTKTADGSGESSPSHSLSGAASSSKNGSDSNLIKAKKRQLVDPSMVNKWFSSKNSNAAKSSKRLPAGVITSKEESLDIRHETCNDKSQLKYLKNKNKSSSSQSSLHLLPDDQKIDPTVLKELPSEIRLSIIQEISSRRRQQQKNSAAKQEKKSCGSIKDFFKK